MAANNFYLTTPIYYVNARPHIGHAYSTIVADVLARRHRLLGDDTYFLTGTDEHGQKIERAAAAAGIPPQQYADQVSKTFSDLWARMGITHDQFIRTTADGHKQGAQKLFADLYAKGQIYLSSYTGQYSVGEEMFVEGPPGTIGPDGKPTETVTEENFFFKLSEYQEKLINLIESNELFITPESSRNEVLEFLRGNWKAELAQQFPTAKEHLRALSNWDDGVNPTVEEMAQYIGTADSGLHGNAKKSKLGFYVPGALRDLSVSRSSFTWGIPVPEPAASETKQKHVIYVWLDALANYMTALGYGSIKPDGTPDDALWQKFWPADIHLVGKEITRFHCVYWPAFLLAAGLPVPKQVTANGWLLFDNSKMSKSKGNVVRTETILDAFGTLCPEPPPTPSELVILSETKDLLSSDSPTSSTESTNRRGTASAVPSDSPQQGALAPEVSLATPHDRDLFAADILRYYLLREIPFGQDGSFSFDSLITRYNADLANGYGNLVSRTLSMIQQYFDGTIPVSGVVRDTNFSNPYARFDWDTLYWIFSDAPQPDFIKDWLSHYNEHNFAGTVGDIFSGISMCDSVLTHTTPWKLAKRPADRPRLSGLLYEIAESIRIITALLYPILPYATARVWAQLGLGDIEAAAREGELTNLQWGGLQPGTKLGPLSPIFPRADKGLAQIMIDNEEKLTSQNSHLKTESTTSERPEAPLKSASTPAPAAHVPTDPTDPAAAPRALADPSGILPVAGSTATTTHSGHTPSHTEIPASGIFAQQPATENLQPTTPTITIDDFAKIELRVAQIVLAERIPKADKLLRLEVDLGPHGTRQILSGIAEFYTPEELTGRRIVVITNLAPRKMRGLESHGMLLAAADGDHGKPHLATCGDEIPLGSRLK